MALVTWRVDDHHADALTDRGGQLLVVFVAGFQALLVDVDLFVEERLEFRLERGLELIDERFDEIVLAVAVADEAGVLERHVKGPRVQALPARPAPLSGVSWPSCYRGWRRGP